MNNVLLNDKIKEITHSLYDINFEKMPISLFEGMGGISYFFFEKINSDYASKKDKDFFIYLIELLVEKLNGEQYSFTYCDGLCGIAFILKKYQLTLNQYDYDLEDLLQDIDSILMQALEKISDHDDINTDFLHGSFGLLYYFVFFKERGSRFKALYVKNITSVINYINKAKKSDEININYGLAHGLCSVINIAKLYLENIDKYCEVSKHCLNLCCEMFTAPELNFTLPSLYPSISPIKQFHDRAARHSVHLGWCYGDQTISTTLNNVANFQNNQELNQFSLNIANHWVRRDSIGKALLNEDFYDHMMCHGVACVALYNKLWFTITKDQSFYKNYTYFINNLLSQKQDFDNVAGYKRAVINNEYEKSYGLLTGVAGVGLLLLDASNMERKSWYDLFLI
ncbi:lanthionine synthetase LanC family protein [Chryseobacterium flavum]|uniref:lanthionine synthetase LanC family protein n=1 Tax=Chryseobacterium flavum TaxID=415851 RepID=UPI002FDB0F28